MSDRDFVNDALLGVAVEFMSREELSRDPVAGMRGYGSHGQPPGTWSDDSSLTFCLTEMLCGEYDLDNLARLIYGWQTIPSEWLAVLARKEEIEQLGGRLNAKLNK
jgi:ADP-ribosyl-[dinitrogen reductase] hydrolase